MGTRWHGKLVLCERLQLQKVLCILPRWMRLWKSEYQYLGVINVSPMRFQGYLDYKHTPVPLPLLRKWDKLLMRHSPNTGLIVFVYCLILVVLQLWTCPDTIMTNFTLDFRSTAQVINPASGAWFIPNITSTAQVVPSIALQCRTMA